MTAREKLAEAVLAAAGLSKDAQELIAEEMLARVSDLSQSQLNPAQQREVKKRLSKPRRYATGANVRALFRRYNPGL